MCVVTIVDLMCGKEVAGGSKSACGCMTLSATSTRHIAIYSRLRGGHVQETQQQLT